MDRRHWLDCPCSLTHGNVIQRMIFTKEDAASASKPEDPKKEGAILRFIDSFSRGYLEPGTSSVPHINEGIQEVFFVAGGSGDLVSAGQKQRLKEGDGIIVPPGVEHTFVNEHEFPLELLIVVESVPEDVLPKNKAPLVRSYRESELLPSHWTYLVHSVFGQEDGLVHLRDVLVVGIEPMQTGDTHGHGPDMDEIWYMWKGQGVHVVGREVCVQTPGTAVSVCPSDPGHTLINHTEEPLQTFYFCSLDKNTPNAS